MIAACPEDSGGMTNTILKEKCSTILSQRMNLFSLSLDLLIPVSTPDNLTYANAYCALCHGEKDFEYWNIRVLDIPGCYKSQLVDYLKGLISLSDAISDPDCPPIVLIDPTPYERMKFWMKEQIENLSYGRYSKFCFDEFQMPKCSLISDSGTVKNDSCKYKENQIYGICKSWSLNSPCTECSENHLANRCWDYFDFYFFDNTFLGDDKIYSYDTQSLRIEILSSLVSNVFYGFGERQQDVQLQCNSSDIPNNCIFPNPLRGECQKLPCSFYESCFYNGSCRSPNVTTSIQSSTKFSSESSIATKSLLASIIALILTILLYKIIPELQSNYTHFQLNCFLMLLATNICMFISATVTSCKPLCYLVATFLHFSLLSSFTWMMVTSFIILHAFRSLNRQISSANAAQSIRGNSSKKFVAYIVGHLLPALFVGSCGFTDSYIQSGTVGYGGDSFCWIQSTKSLMVTFVIPTSIIFSGNLLLLIECGIFLITFHSHSASLPDEKKKQRLVMITMFKLVTGMVIQWLFGIMSHAYPENNAIWHVFIVSLSVHGILTLLSTMMLKVVRHYTMGLFEKVVAKVKTLNSGTT